MTRLQERQTYEATVERCMMLEVVAREVLGSPYAARHALGPAPGLAEIGFSGEPARPARTRRSPTMRPTCTLPTHLSDGEIAAELYV